MNRKKSLISLLPPPFPLLPLLQGAFPEASVADVDNLEMEDDEDSSSELASSYFD